MAESQRFSGLSDRLSVHHTVGTMLAAHTPLGLWIATHRRGSNSAFSRLPSGRAYPAGLQTTSVPPPSSHVMLSCVWP